jgi:hypothetical protein
MGQFSGMGCGCHLTRDEMAIGIIAELVAAIDELADRAENFSVSGVYFDEPCMTANVAALKRARDAVTSATGVA